MEEFVEVLKLLEKRANVKSVDIIIRNLLEGKNFSRLNDGITKRKYAIGKITMMGGREFSLIEIEREDKALSMLILKGKKSVKWDKICGMLLLGLVEGNGKWSNNDINEITKMGIGVYRNKHIKRKIYEQVNFIYGRLS